MELNKIYNMDCLEGMKQIGDNSIDLIVTDPPYGIKFMGKKWDINVPSVEICKEMCKVLKHGAFAFICMSPRQDVLSKMIGNLHESGFETNFTSLYWAYASGFPKAMNMSKKVVDFLGVERGDIPTTGNLHKGSGNSVQFTGTQKDDMPRTQKDDMPRTQKAQELDGSYAAFQPKPAVEVIIVAMKSLSQGSYIKQALDNGKGVTWLDDCRVPFESEDIDSEACPSLRQSEAQLKSDFKIGVNTDYQTGKLTFKGDGTGQNNFAQYLVDKRGRFPANLLVSDDVLNDGRIIKASEGGRAFQNSIFNTETFEGLKDVERYYHDIGSFSRYFSLDNWFQDKVKKLPDKVKKTFPFLIVPKASPSEKQERLDNFQKKQWVENSKEDKPQNGSAAYRKNFHPTVKPIDLMAYLVTLGSRNNDIVLDPFIGSGTTAIACRILNRNFIGFEISAEYCKIAEGRIKDYMVQKRVFETI